MKSKYLSSIKLKDNLYAVYNSLMCYPIYMNTEEKEKLFNNEISYFTKKDIEKMYQLGLLVDDHIVDENALTILKDTVKKGIKNKISLMYLIPTNTCNLACKYCFIGNTACGKAVENMPWSTAQIAIDKFYLNLKKNHIKKGAIICYGAEPTVCWNLIRQCAIYIKEKNYNITVDIVTNATLLTEDKVLDIKKYNIGVGISIDGPKEITDANRIFREGNESVYKYVEKAIQLLKKHNVFFNLSVTISDYFIKNSNKILQWLIDLKVSSINFNLMHYSNKTDEWKTYYPKASKFLIKAYEKLKENGIQDDRVFRKVESFYDRKFKFSDCGAMGATQITIKPNGDICICHGYWNSKDHKCGNIINNEIEDIFNTDYYTSWQNNLTLYRKKCLNCKYLFVCGGGCAQQSERLFGSPYNVDKSFCIYTKKSFKWLLLKHYYSQKV